MFDADLEKKFSFKKKLEKNKNKIK